MGGGVCRREEGEGSSEGGMQGWVWRRKAEVRNADAGEKEVEGGVERRGGRRKAELGNPEEGEKEGGSRG